MAYIAEQRPDVVIVVDRWDARAGDLAAFEANLQALTADLLPYVGRVVFVEQPPVVALDESINLREYAAWRGHEGPVRHEPRSHAEPRRAATTEALRRLAASHPQVSFVPVADLFGDRVDEVLVADNGEYLYFDDDHLAEAGARRVADRIRAAVAP